MKEPIFHARDDRQGEQGGVEVGHALDGEPGGFNGLSQRLPAVAPMMVQHHVMLAPHPCVRGHGNQDGAARREAIADALQRSDIGPDVFQAVEQADQIEAGAPEGHVVGAVPLPNVEASTGLSTGDGTCLGVHLDSMDTPVGGKHVEVAAGARTDFQNRGIRRQGQATDDIAENASAALKPPVMVFGAGHIEIGFRRHGAFPRMNDCVACSTRVCDQYRQGRRAEPDVIGES